MRLIHKIFAVILEEINGYSKEEAEKLAAENEGSEAYTRINSLLSENGIEDEDSDYMLNVPKIKYEIDLILDDLNKGLHLIESKESPVELKLIDFYKF